MTIFYINYRPLLNLSNLYSHPALSLQISYALLAIQFETLDTGYNRSAAFYIQLALPEATEYKAHKRRQLRTGMLAHPK